MAKKLAKSVLQAFANSARQTAMRMVIEAKSGHPGGSLSAIDFLAVLYLQEIVKDNNPIVISNGHISPAIYAILAELSLFSKRTIVQNFRQGESIYEGHVSTHVPGVYYSTGPLGCGLSAATGFALAHKLKQDPRKVYAACSDGELQEGQIWEAARFASKYKLDNLIVILDANDVQLSGSLKEIMPVDIKASFKACHWDVLTCDGHDFAELQETIAQAKNCSKPTVIIAKTIMGKNVSFMEQTGRKYQSTWHGKVPSQQQLAQILTDLKVPEKDLVQLKKFLKKIKYKPYTYRDQLRTKDLPQIDPGQPRSYPKDEITDCRTAYGNALLDLALINPQIVAADADLSGSVKTSFLKEALPNKYFNVGISEQHLVTLGGGLSMAGFVPFVSTFGAFMTSRAKDQARLNDINETNLKMVSTHCGLSLGQDGTTHHAIDDVNSFLGHLNTQILEPVDPNQCDRIIRTIAAEHGNFYVRMGRHKFPIILDTKGQPFFAGKYKFRLGKADFVRKGKKLTIIATGPCLYNACQAVDDLNDRNMVDLIALSSLKKIDTKVLKSIQKTQKLIVISDHLDNSGVFSVVSQALVKNSIMPKKLKFIGVKAYHKSADQKTLYKNAGFDTRSIFNIIKKII
ncbi:transketolase [bacterium]|nr:transketolase [bacterium]